MHWLPTRARERVVLYGGSVRTEDNLADTWEWDGTGWTQPNA